MSELNTGIKMITILGRNEFIHMSGCDKDWIIKHDAVNRTILIGRRMKGVQKVLGFNDMAQGLSSPQEIG